MGIGISPHTGQFSPEPGNLAVSLAYEQDWSSSPARPAPTCADLDAGRIDLSRFDVPKSAAVGAGTGAVVGLAAAALLTPLTQGLSLVAWVAITGGGAALGAGGTAAVTKSINRSNDTFEAACQARKTP